MVMLLCLPLFLVPAGCTSQGSTELQSCLLELLTIMLWICRDPSNLLERFFGLDVMLYGYSARWHFTDFHILGIPRSRHVGFSQLIGQSPIQRQDDL